MFMDTPSPNEAIATLRPGNTGPPCCWMKAKRSRFPALITATAAIKRQAPPGVQDANSVRMRKMTNGGNLRIGWTRRFGFRSSDDLFDECFGLSVRR